MGTLVSEIAQVEVGDFMFASGKLRLEVNLRVVVTKGAASATFTRQAATWLSLLRIGLPFASSGARE